MGECFCKGSWKFRIQAAKELLSSPIFAKKYVFASLNANGIYLSAFLRRDLLRTTGYEHWSPAPDADQDCEGTLRVYQRLKSGKRLLQSAEVTLQKGANAFLLPQELRDAGFYEYEATIESDADTVVANNEGRSFSVVHGEPTVLYVAGESEASTRMEKALRDEGLEVVDVSPGRVPVSLAQFQNFSTVVLSNVSSTDLTTEQLRSMEALVRDLGIGLVMIGGPDSFGAGGYLDTPVEDALPVDMDLKQRKVMPRGALVLCLHTCEFADGNAWAREISLAALKVLSAQDLMGATAYMSTNGGYGDAWLIPLQPVGDKHYMRIKLNTTSIGDMPSVQPGLRMAYKALKGADAAVKRVIMISDGDPAAPTVGLLNSLKKEKIAVSTVCINPHSPTDQDMLRWVAEKTGGEFYYVSNPNRLPQIFTKEAAVVKRGLLVEKPFQPKPKDRSELLPAPVEELPQLRGYVVTTPKESATVALVSHEGDPVLAHWRYGLGKSLAFTSDATNRWAPDWLAWEGFDRFWAQAVRWSLRDMAASSFRVETKVRDGQGYVRIDAVDDQGKFVNFLRPRGKVVGPGPDFERGDVSLMQTGPGIYEGTFPVSERGVYMLNLTYTREDGSQGMIPAGLALGYSREYNYNTTNHVLLEELASVGGGRVLGPDDNPFEHTLEASATATPVWPFLVVIAVCLFPFEIFVRRVVVDFMAVYARAAAAARKIPALGRLVPIPRPRRVPLTGVYGSLSEASRHFVYTSSGDGVIDLAGVGAPEQAATVGMRAGTAEAREAFEEAATRGHTEYTSQLLAAKERALKQRKRGSGDTDNE